MKKTARVFVMTLSLLAALSPFMAHALSVQLRVEAPSGTLYDKTLSVDPCPVTDDPATTTVSSKCALEQAGLSPQWSPSGDDWFLTSAGGAAQDFANNLYWGWWSDLSYGSVALNKHELHDGEHLLIALGVLPLRLTISPAPTAGTTTTVAVEEFGFDASFNGIWKTSSGATVHAGSATYTTDASGTAQVPIENTDPLTFSAQKTGFAPSDSTLITPLPGNVPTVPAATVPITLEIDTATTTVFSGPVSVPACTTAHNASSTENGFCAFDAADIPVDASWFSFGAMINAIAGYAGDASNYWLWFLNGDAASVGIDSYILQPGDHILWTIGREPLKVSVASSSPAVGATTTVTVLGFDTNMFSFAPIAGALVQAGGATTTTDAAGHADILATSTDPMSLTITAPGFLPGTAITLAPWAPAAVATVPAPAPASGGGGGGGGITHRSFDIPHALGFLTGIQQADGSFGAPLYDDWMAFAFSATDPGTAKNLLREHLRTGTPSLSSITDYERHAMALEALGIDPYAGTSVDTISPIVAAFDGTQIGSPSQDNDDIFAIFPLLHAGYSTNDDIIVKTITSIASAQRPDGSWDGNPDMTAAALQALTLASSQPGVADATARGVAYLKQTQQQDGGWGSAESTSWVKTALNALGASDSAWASAGGLYPSDALAAAQQADGGVRPQTDAAGLRTWSTSYTVIATSGKSWSALLSSFSKPAATSIGGGAATTSADASTTPAVTPAATSTVATSTTPVATSTPALPPVATSTAATVIAPVPATPPQLRRIPRVSTVTAATSSPDRSPIMPSASQTASAATTAPHGFFAWIWSLARSLFW